MPNPRPPPEARELDRIEALATVNDTARADEFLDRCVPGSEWTVRVRTAEVSATLISRPSSGHVRRASVRTRLSLWLSRARSRRAGPPHPGFRPGRRDSERHRRRPSLGELAIKKPGTRADVNRSSHSSAQEHPRPPASRLGGESR